MGAGIEQSMILPQQFFPAIPGNGAKLVVDVGYPAGQIGLGKNRGGIHGPAVLLIHESDSLLLTLAAVEQQISADHSRNISAAKGLTQPCE
jgi:hypothetical protein